MASKTVQDLTNNLISTPSLQDQSNNFAIYINGQQLPPHTGFKVDTEDLYEDGWRDEQGIQHGTLIRKDVRKLFFEFRYLTKEDVKYILGLVSSGQYVEVSYPDDPITGQRHTITAYRGTNSLQEHGSYKGFTIWETLSFNLIER